MRGGEKYLKTTFIKNINKTVNNLQCKIDYYQVT